MLDTKPYREQETRSWNFRSVGYGNGPLYWKDMISNLRLAGYDHVISVEHEDGLMSRSEGLAKACGFLKRHYYSRKGGYDTMIAKCGTVIIGYGGMGGLAYSAA